LHHEAHEGHEEKNSCAKAQRAPRQKRFKFEARNPKLETISMAKSSNVPNELDSDLSLDFTISNFEIVSDFDIRISNLDKVI
jgi:hypothetical protein